MKVDLQDLLGIVGLNGGWRAVRREERTPVFEP
jgi:hypothetical protein